MDCNCKKRKVAAASAVCGVLAVLGIGYGASVAQFDTVLQRSKDGLASYINATLNPPAGKEISVEILDQKTGFLSHDLTIYIVGGKDKIKIPAQASIGFLNYSFDFDLAKATGNDELLLKLADLDKVTYLDAHGELSLLSSNFKFELNTEYLNNFDLFAESVNSDKELADLKQNLGYKDLGKASLILTLDSEEKMHTSLNVNNFAHADIYFAELNYSSSSQGLKQYKNFGTHHLNVANLSLFQGSGVPVYSIKNIALYNDSSKVSGNGAFNSDYSLSISNLGDEYKNLNLSGQISNLNVNSINDLLVEAEANGYGLGPYNIINFFINHPITFTVDPTSSVTYTTEVKSTEKYGKPHVEDIVFNFDSKISSKGNAQTNKGEESVFDGYFTVKTPFDVNRIIDGDVDFNHFFVKNEKGSQCTFDFSVSPLNPELNIIKLNGVEQK